jgi:2-polyprenyl-6-methoxyphenol hydroxylase-like FAD-dependent oxidoreductase
MDRIVISGGGTSGLATAIVCSQMLRVGRHARTAGPDAFPGAPERFRDRRRLRTAPVQLQSREVKEQVYDPSKANAFLRNAVMLDRSSEVRCDQMDDAFRARVWKGRLAGNENRKINASVKIVDIAQPVKNILMSE